MSKETQCRTCHVEIIANSEERHPQCSSCEGKVVELSDTLVRVVRADIETRPRKPMSFPNPYRTNPGVIDGAQFLQALVRANGGDYVRKAAEGN